MYTIFYKGFYINCYCDRDECSIALNGIDTEERFGYTFKSVKIGRAHV